MSKTKVDFILNSDIVSGAASATLFGDFNNWDAAKGVSLKKQKDGSFKTSVSLDAGQSYQYRYLLNDGRWVNDSNADAYIFQAEFGAENCVINVPAEAKVAAKKEVTKKVAPVKAEPVAKKEAKVTKPAVKAKANKEVAVKAPAVKAKAVPAKAKAVAKAK